MNKNWFVSLIYSLCLSLVIMNIVAIIAFAIIKFFLLVIHGVTPEFSLPDVLKYLKAACVAGVIISFGGWYTNYRHHNHR